MDQIGTDGEGRYSLDAFVHFMKRYQHAQHQHHQTNNSYYDQEPFARPTSPIHRPPSASKHSRQAVYSSASSGHHHTRISRYPMSPTAAATSSVYNDQDTFTPDDPHLIKRRQEMTRTPDVSFYCMLPSGFCYRVFSDEQYCNARIRPVVYVCACAYMYPSFCRMRSTCVPPLMW